MVRATPTCEEDAAAAAQAEQRVNGLVAAYGLEPEQGRESGMVGRGNGAPQQWP